MVARADPYNNIPRELFFAEMFKIHLALIQLAFQGADTPELVYDHIMSRYAPPTSFHEPVEPHCIEFSEIFRDDSDMFITYEDDFSTAPPIPDFSNAVWLSELEDAYTVWLSEPETPKPASLGEHIDLSAPVMSLATRRTDFAISVFPPVLVAECEADSFTAAPTVPNPDFVTAKGPTVPTTMNPTVPNTEFATFTFTLSLWAKPPESLPFSLEHIPPEHNSPSSPFYEPVFTDISLPRELTDLVEPLLGSLEYRPPELTDFAITELPPGAAPTEPLPFSPEHIPPEHNSPSSPSHEPNFINILHIPSEASDTRFTKPTKSSTPVDALMPKLIPLLQLFPTTVSPEASAPGLTYTVQMADVRTPFTMAAEYKKLLIILDPVIPISTSAPYQSGLPLFTFDHFSHIIIMERPPPRPPDGAPFPPRVPLGSPLS
jgi:hypothetical protein